MKKKNVILLIVTGVLLSAFLVSGCNPSPKSDNSADNPPLNVSQNKESLVSKEVVLYFGDDEAMYLIPEKRTIKINSTDKLPAGAIINELIEGPHDKSLRPTIPKEAKLISAKVEDKIAYVDFTEEIRTKHWGGSAGETMTIASIVNTLTELDDIDKVQILIGGEKQDTLVGHWYIGEPIERIEDTIKE
ncbi:MAG: GerMN domain-containing protein [Syntrophomonadaceae bacterium]|nr:GerMN domain-containing protein [Syntrophomonadaceae bacterium]MDD3889588.1 GerMN domain-containing protein [Syntrophomonadaceae bacterium]MDD4548358.1 GerMN domain-containing protein [Syntrophomonadaceae bacterium]